MLAQLKRILEQSQLRIAPRSLAALSLALWLILAPSAIAESEASLEAEVLQIIRTHPEIVWEALQTYQQQEQERQQQARQQVLSAIATRPDLAIATSPTRGAEEAPLLLLEFSDFQCPYCGAASQTIQEFVRDRGDDVRLVYKHYPLVGIHPQALNAAQAAWAAQQQGRFWEYHDALFTHQEKLGEDFYLALANDLYLDLEQFDRDRTSSAAKQAIARDVALAETLGIEGTPLFVLNTVSFYGAPPRPQLDALLDQQLAIVAEADEDRS